MSDLQIIRVKVDPNYPHFGLLEEPGVPTDTFVWKPGSEYVRVINLATGEHCHKCVYENTKGKHFKHKGYSPTYLKDMVADAIHYPLQTVFIPYVPPRTEESEEHKTLWNKRDGCTGEVVSASGGGAKCTKCPGWFCY